MIKNYKKIDYEKCFEEFRDESFEHLEDHDIDNIDKYCKEFLKNDNEVKKIVKGANRFNILVLISLLIMSMMFYYLCFFLFNEPSYNVYFYYFEFTTLGALIYWYFFLSPSRAHQFRDANGKLDDRIFIKYRAILEQEHSLIKQISDNKKEFVIFTCFLASAIAIFSVIEDWRVTPYLNLIYMANSEMIIADIPSVVPALMTIFIFANVINLLTISSLKKENAITDETLNNFQVRKVILLIFSGIFLVLNLIIAVLNVDNSSAYWFNANSVNTNNWASFSAAWITQILYIFIFLGSAVIGILILLGLSALEGGYIKMKYRQKIESLHPEENNWEYGAVVKRHDAEKACRQKTRVKSAIELIVVILLAVGGYWTLWIADTIWNNELLYNLMIVELAIVIFWVFIFSGFFHYKREKAYYFKDPHLNWKTAEFEERGLGSWKTYYREDIKKRKQLIMFLLYFNLLGLWGLAFFHEVMYDMFLKIFGVSESVVAPAMIIVYVVLNVSFLIYTANATIMNNSTEGKVYKFFLLFVMSCFTFSSVLIINAYREQMLLINWLSFDMILGLTITFLIFILFAFLLVYIIFPVAIRFDNFEAPKKDIIAMLISTIFLMIIFSVLFNAFLPQIDSSGNAVPWIVNGYTPMRIDPKEDPELLWKAFNLGEFLVGTYGYIWWGFVQQYLFMSYFLRLLTKIFPNSKGLMPAVFSSCIFGIIHYPDWPLMMFTGVASIMWAYYWQHEYTNKEGKLVRGNNLYLWGLVHGFGGTFVNLLLPITMSVGPFNA